MKILLPIDYKSWLFCLMTQPFFDLFFLFFWSFLAILSPLIWTCWLGVLFFYLPSGSPGLFLNNIFCTGLIAVALAAVHAIKSYQVEHVHQRLLTRVLHAIWSRLLSHPLFFSEVRSPQAWLSCLNDYEQALKILFEISFSIFFQSLSLFSMWFLTLFFYPFWGGIFLFFYMIFGITKWNIMKKINFHKKIFSQLKVLYLEFMEILFLNMKSIRSICSQRKTYNLWEKFFMPMRQAFFFYRQYENLFLCIDFFWIAFCLWTFSLFLSFSTQNTWGSLIPLMACSIQSVFLVKTIAQNALTLSENIPQLHRLAPLAEKSERPLVIPPGPLLKGQICLHSVCFEHETGTHFLGPLSLEIEAGEFIGIQGASGVGKSSLLKLLLGFERPHSGHIDVDGERLEGEYLQQVLSQSGLVLQNSSLFPGTIFSNMAAHVSISLSDAWELAEQVGLAEEIKKMPMQFLTYVSDEGSGGLSGGQKQKLLIARALASRPRILFLDEATSALDAESQSLIHAHLRTLRITRLVIAHRKSALLGADRIYELKQGLLQPISKN